jgi:hypothetical protein
MSDRGLQVTTQETASRIANGQGWKTFFLLITGFSLLILSGYIVLWRESNKNLAIAGASFVGVVLGIALSADRRVTICAALAFTTFRWLIGAVFTGDRRAIFATIAFAVVPVWMILHEIWKVRKADGHPPSTSSVH